MGSSLDEKTVASFLEEAPEVLRGETSTKANYIVYSDGTAKKIAADGSETYISLARLISVEEYGQMVAQLKQYRQNYVKPKCSEESANLFEECLKGPHHTDKGVFVIRTAHEHEGKIAYNYGFSSLVESVKLAEDPDYEISNMERLHITPTKGPKQGQFRPTGPKKSVDVVSNIKK